MHLFNFVRLRVPFVMSRQNTFVHVSSLFIIACDYQPGHAGEAFTARLLNLLFLSLALTMNVKSRSPSALPFLNSILPSNVYSRPAQEKLNISNWSFSSVEILDYEVTRAHSYHISNFIE